MFITEKLTSLNSEAGDTLIEVLLATAVLGFVIVGAAVAVNRNILIMEDHQEHAQAIKLVESQIEDLRNQVYSTSVGCFSNQTSGSQVTAVDAVPTAEANGNPQGNNRCIVQNDGSKALSDSVPAYKLSITDDDPTEVHTNYTVSASWESPLGSTDQVSLEYRIQ